jgi:hypothetical protein
MQKQPPEYEPEYPRGFSDRMLVYDFFAESRHWTPRQVDELTLDEVFWLPLVEAARHLAREALADKK